MRLATIGALVLTVVLAAHGLAVIVGGGSYDSSSDRMVYGIGQVIIAAGIAGGLLVSPQRQWSGVVLVVVSIAALSVLLYWFLIVTIPIGVGLAWLAYLRGRGERPRSALVAPESR